jgi:hypothetical protein
VAAATRRAVLLLLAPKDNEKILLRTVGSMLAANLLSWCPADGDTRR